LSINTLDDKFKECRSDLDDSSIVVNGNYTILMKEATDACDCHVFGGGSKECCVARK